MNKKEVTALALVALTANAVTVLHNNMRRRKPTPKPVPKSRPRDNDLCAVKCASRRVEMKHRNGGYSTKEQMLNDFEFEVIVHDIR